MSMEDAENELPTFFDPATCTRKGLCPVTKIRGQEGAVESHSLYYEQHGSGTKYKVLLVMGLNSSSFAWSNQIKYFGNLPDCSIVAFDNRGVGNSGTPRGPYSTNGMAEDAIVLLDMLGWTSDIHVVGISLGGMIAQEMATRILTRITSLTLIVTTPGGFAWSNFPPSKGLKHLVRLLFIPEPEQKVPYVLDMLFTQKWLNEVSTKDPQGRTNRQVQTEIFIRRMTITRKQSPIGALSQMIAGLTHRVTGDRLRSISRNVPKVMLLTGDEDHLVDPSNSRRLKAAMPEAELVEWTNSGHGIQAQYPDKLHALLEKTFEEGRSKAVRPH